MRKLFFTVVILFFFISSSFSQSLSNSQIIDLSHSYDAQTIFWPTEKGFELMRENDGITPKGYYYASNHFSTPEHGGTHLDAPKHFFKNGKTTDKIPLQQLMGKAILIDIEKQCYKNQDYRIKVEDIVQWEKLNGTIPQKSILIFRTGFEKYWPNRLKYLGTNERGPEAISKLHFPGLAPETAQWLIQNRQINAVGLDTASIDYGQSTFFETHRILSKNGIVAFENLANLQKLPSKDFQIIALPMKIKGGTGGPLRIIAVIPSLEPAVLQHPNLPK